MSLKRRQPAAKEQIQCRFCVCGPLPPCIVLTNSINSLLLLLFSSAKILCSLHVCCCCFCFCCWHFACLLFLGVTLQTRNNIHHLIKSKLEAKRVDQQQQQQQ
ncbi:unnamed protein product [Ceratitis capitata]|uniref:(Mediterranean fruit fly) hypothetical protein n=1 Tax=Ceratitis capitata TaxID=7213 RepID=A0A811VLT3_CERCA|nr:unnamed protein product [Ceratitis capitata]